MLVTHRTSIFFNSLFKNFIDLKNFIVRFHKERFWDCEIQTFHQLAKLMLVIEFLKHIKRSVNDLDPTRLKLISYNRVKLFRSWCTCWDKHLGVIFFANFDQLLDVLLRLLNCVRDCVEFGDVLAEPAT